MKYLILTVLFSAIVSATSTPILNIKNVSETDRCNNGSLCVELSWMTLDEIKEITVIAEQVTPSANYNSFKLIEKKETTLQVSDQTSVVHVLDSSITESVGDVYRISIDAIYSGTDEKANSGKQTFIVK